eukprot:1195163-Prorocentrum_minimum.AAC.3
MVGSLQVREAERKLGAADRQNPNAWVELVDDRTGKRKVVDGYKASDHMGREVSQREREREREREQEHKEREKEREKEKEIRHHGGAHDHGGHDEKGLNWFGERSNHHQSHEQERMLGEAVIHPKHKTITIPAKSLMKLLKGGFGSRRMLLGAGEVE